MENKLSVDIHSEDTVKKFEAYLRKYENDDKLVVLEVVEKPGSKPGDNYSSMMIRTKIIGTRGDGNTYTKTFMTKKIDKDRKVSTLVDFPTIFRTEVHVYSKILPILGSFGPQFIHADNDTIIMEDLAERGYVLYKKSKYLDLDHTIFTLKKLAKFHASTLAVKINNKQLFDTLCTPLEEVICKDTTSDMKMWIESGMKSTLEYLNLIQPETQELQTVKDHIATCADKLNAMYQQFNEPKQKYDTICHGDPWINNLLFLHDKDGKIVDLKIVDYQVVRYFSLATDILYFIYNSVQSSLIERSFESLIKIYHNEFLSELRRLHIDEEILNELGMEWLNKELRTFAYYGLIFGCLYINLMLAEEEDLERLDSVDMVTMSPQGDINSATNQRKIDRIKCVAFNYYKMLHLGINDDIEPTSITE